MARRITEKNFELRDWQAEAFRKVTENYRSGRSNFLCVATPGAGKTKFALAIAHQFMFKGLVNRIVVVTPTEGLKRQWAETAAVFSGIDIDPDFTNSMGQEALDYHGVAITYALLGQDKKNIHRHNCNNRKTFVIFDEIHHCGNKEHLTWGIAVRNAFENAVFRLSISGTAFRSDDAPIPFVEYENEISIADYTYSYERAIRENVCRPVYFTVSDGTMKWKVGSTEFEHSFKDYLTPDQVSKRLKTALDPKGNWVRDVLKAADERLIELRRTHHDAAGLIFAATQKHANEIAKVLYSITGIQAPVVVSDEGDGSELIDQFRRSTDRWLVSVKMVSEGVDIPRLRLGVYLSNIKAELFFRQVIGRFVRVLEHLQFQDAFIYIPQDKEVVKLAETIQEERDHALNDPKLKGKNGQSDLGYTDLFGNYTPALTGKFIPLGSELSSSRTIAVNVEISSGMKDTVDARIDPLQSPVFIQKKLLRDQLNELAKRYALKLTGGNRNTRPDFKAAHRLWIENGGKNMEIETTDELRRRVNYYKNLLRRS